MPDSTPETMTCTRCQHDLDESFFSYMREYLIYSGFEHSPITVPVYCNECFDLEYFECVRCLEYTPSAERYGARDDGNICMRCMDISFFICEGCGDIVHNDYCRVNDDDYSLCPECYDQYGGDSVSSYGDKSICDVGPYGSSPNGRYIGIEIETECSSRTNPESAAKAILANCNASYRHVVCKHDGSLCNGFEIVTAPMTMAYARKWIPKAFIHPVRGLQAWNADSEDHGVGMHIHVSRDSISILTLGKLNKFINASENRRFLETLGGRRWNTYCRGYDKSFGEVKHRNHDRYEALNISNRETIEFRFFRSNLKPSGILRNVDFVHSVLEWCEMTSVSKQSRRSSPVRGNLISKDGWENYVTWMSDKRKAYPYLYAWLVHHGYLNGKPILDRTMEVREAEI